MNQVLQRLPKEWLQYAAIGHLERHRYLYTVYFFGVESEAIICSTDGPKRNGGSIHLSQGVQINLTK